MVTTAIIFLSVCGLIIFAYETAREISAKKQKRKAYLNYLERTIKRQQRTLLHYQFAEFQKEIGDEI